MFYRSLSASIARGAKAPRNFEIAQTNQLEQPRRTVMPPDGAGAVRWKIARPHLLTVCPRFVILRFAAQPSLLTAMRRELFIPHVAEGDHHENLVETDCRFSSSLRQRLACECTGARGGNHCRD